MLSPATHTSARTVVPPPAGRRRIVRSALAVLLGAAVLYAAHVTVGLGGPGRGDLRNKWFYEAIELSAAIICLGRARVGSDRRAWGAIGVAMVLNCLGDMYTDHVLAGMSNPPYPSWADAAYLASYPPLYVGVMLLIRARDRPLRTGGGVLPTRSARPR